MEHIERIKRLKWIEGDERGITKEMRINAIRDFTIGYNRCNDFNCELSRVVAYEFESETYRKVKDKDEYDRVVCETTSKLIRTGLNNAFQMIIEGINEGKKK
ncbi:unnamed protein product [Ambrosiozyma monospora]|uniref:Unnamed protein product n=1 Tax=Ambrosiozyma monospora TaxID=43982 RepID=A0ACB5TAI8_AMBMO|nr:unnamed protein product [Ambrosiozyma monospora]